MTASEPPSGFFAYPSRPAIAEAIRNGVAKINQLGLIDLRTWESLSVGGKSVIGEICKHIDSAKVFCADLTGLNPNVMFELGYAIARNKRIWIAIDRSYNETAEGFNKLKILTTVGYADYRNSDDLLAKFVSDNVVGDLDATIFNASIKPLLGNQNRETVLYLKSRHMSEASTVISKGVDQIARGMGCQLIIDDPRETAVQPLAWYSEQAYTAKCAVIHLLNPSREGALLHNTKYAFVAGLVHGFGKPLLILADSEFSAPIDYRDLLAQYQTATEAERYLQRWSVPIIEAAKASVATHGSYLAQVKLAQKLTELDIGEPIAENEAPRLVRDYFVETTFYRDALNGRQGIFVGRKGAGKSATFFKLAATLNADRRNLVCLIKPLAYEMYGMVDLLKKYLSINLRSYVIESIWKFLLYSELALAVERSIHERPSEQIHGSELNLVAVLDQNNEMLRQDFSVRLERCITSMLHSSGASSSSEIEAHRNAIAQALHSGIIKRLREVLVEALSEKQRVAILVDNLDKAWDKQGDIDVLSEFILGLLGATSRVSDDFSNVGPKRQTINVSLAVFLRADIFYKVISLAREPDKIVYSKLTWNDDEMLLAVVDERFANVLSTEPREVWAKYFCGTVAGVETKQYIVSRILKRPRDLLVFVKAAITVAANRRHSRVEEKDVIEAEKQYSQFAVDSVLVEHNISDILLEPVLFEFVGAKAIVDETQVRLRICRVHQDSTKSDAVIKLLLNLTFLGVEVKEGQFRFAEDQSEAQKNSVLAHRLVTERGTPARFKINPAFWAFLEIDSNNQESCVGE